MASKIETKLKALREKRAKRTEDKEMARAKEFLRDEAPETWECYSFGAELLFKLRDELKLNQELSAREAFENVMDELEGA